MWRESDGAGRCRVVDGEGRNAVDLEMGDCVGFRVIKCYRMTMDDLLLWEGTATQVLARASCGVPAGGGDTLKQFIHGVLV